jgi:hypothetical protein
MLYIVVFAYTTNSHPPPLMNQLVNIIPTRAKDHEILVCYSCLCAGICWDIHVVNNVSIFHLLLFLALYNSMFELDMLFYGQLLYPVEGAFC